jgi:hypothetical protein
VIQFSKAFLPSANEYKYLFFNMIQAIFCAIRMAGANGSVDQRGDQFLRFGSEDRLGRAVGNRGVLVVRSACQAQRACRSIN